ncbi:MAG: THxN family PEP-CTERM protein [Gammaproteobacteria bacterium]|nr:THxN family PEP-CTERM protein [Gammaproteobacteria bacterium]
MKSIVFNSILTVGLVLGLASFSANAALMTSGSWSDPQGSAPTTIWDPQDNIISWGTSAGYGQSKWMFNGVDKDLGTDDIISGEWFKIGKLLHWNRPIYDYDFTGATLNLSMALDGENLSPLSMFFGHEETLNYPCKKETGKGCPDIVTIPTLAENTITIGGMIYEMTITGWSRNRGMYSQFVTHEKRDNKAYLFAKLAKVPEPSIIMLFGIGLLGLGFACRRKAHG